MDIGAIMKAKKAWNTFVQNHPRFPDFLRDVQNKGIIEGTEIAVTVTWPDGTVKKAGIVVRQSDLDILELANNIK